ncbi:MAG: hypothetical protein APF76_10380 [Desulfitibacter sp. BRH_c19]|nr:MAG: hypothetical protein APF76_10380 [Desulfitibacter sp. BRH_c19]
MEPQINQEVVRPNPFPYAIVILIFIFVFGGLGVWYYYPSSKWVDNQSLDRLIIDEDPISTEDYSWENDSLLVSLDLLKENFDPYIYWEPENNKMIVTTKDKVIEMNSQQLTAYINSEPVPLSIPFTLLDDKPYVPLEFLAPLYGITIDRLESGITVIDYLDQPILTGIVKQETFLRSETGYRSSRVQDLLPEEELLIFREEDGWYQSRSADGKLGYVDKNHVFLQEIKVASNENSSITNPPWKPMGGKINLTWDYISRPRYDMSNYDSIPGLNVIAPRWFHLADGDGNIINHGSLPYMEWAHNQGLQVWALFSNSFDPEITTEMLRNFDNRKNVINQLVVLAELFNLDGINIDFENVYYEDRDYLTQFLRELTPILHEQNLTVSIDVTIRSTSPNWSMFYDRPEISKIVDYVAVMTYDEHWSSSSIAGSVASLPWVENGLIRMLEQVPKDKLLLGVPFYTRVWEEEMMNDGTIQVSSRALSMANAEEILNTNNALIELDETAGQFLGIYDDNNITYKIWLEDEFSMKQRIELVRKYDLAGVASWRRGFENPHIWDVIKEELSRRP